MSRSVVLDAEALSALAGPPGPRQTAIANRPVVTDLPVKSFATCSILL